MGVQTTSQILYDGPTNVVMQFTGIGDGLGDEVAAIKVHMADLNPVPYSVKVIKLEYNVTGSGLVQFLWAASDNVPFLVLNGYDEIDYTFINGMVNGGGDTANGDILISTLGFDAGSSYSVKLAMKKKYR
jgi:hypothetical protein